jgi:hypothetical protein
MEPSLVDQCQPMLGRANRLYHRHKLRINQSTLVLPVPLTYLKPVLLVLRGHKYNTTCRGGKGMR